MAAREWSELVAGPRWKTFLRRFGRAHRGGAARPAKHQYDPVSYALNFDDSAAAVDNSDDEGYPRFVRPQQLTRTSIDADV